MAKQTPISPETRATDGLASDIEHLQQELLALRAQNAKLAKINQALIERVEAAGSASPYAAFQHAATLSEQVRERTALQQQALAQKSLLLQHTVDNLAQGVALADPSGVFQLWNQQFKQLAALNDDQLALPIAANEVLAQSAIASLCLPATTESAFVDNSAVTGAVCNGSMLTLARYLLSDGSTLFTLTDVSEQHRYTETLRASERWIRTITDHIPAMIAYLDADLCFRFTNQGYDEFYGVARGSLLGQAISAVHQQSALAQLQPHFQKVLAGQSTVFEIDEANSVGESRCLLKSYVPNFAAHLVSDATAKTHQLEATSQAGKPLGFFVLIRDITERKQNSAALQQANLLLEQRVLERTQALSALNQQLLAAKKAAEQANLSKSKFLAAISHDLLQPLNAARLFNGSLAEQTEPQQSKSLVAATARSLDNVAQLLSTLVDMSRLEAGVQQVELSIFSLGQLLADLAAEAQIQAQQAGLDIRLAPCSIWVQSDLTLLSRILRNLISNAIRYTPAGGQILLGVRRQTRSVWVQVFDTGVGIAPADQQLIFDEFKRLYPQSGSAVKPNAAWQTEGLGLGLAIVQKTAALLHHRLALSSVLGQGSTFAIELPRVAAMKNAPYSELALLSSIDAASVESTWLAPFKAKQIWVIDNCPQILQAMHALLSQWGCQVVCATSEAELLHKLTAAQAKHVKCTEHPYAATAMVTSLGPSPDLIIVDYHLDYGCSGVDVAGRLRAKLGNAALPVLVISAEGSAELRARLQILECQFLAKPVSPIKLKALMHRLLAPALC